jgi:hypothetical protein
VGRVERRHHDVQDRYPPHRQVPHPRRDQPGPTAIRSPSNFTTQPIAIAALTTQLLGVEVGRRPQKGGV